MDHPLGAGANVLLARPDVHVRALGLARTRPGHPLQALSWLLAVALPSFVLASRLYRGMHWPTDVAASVVFTVTWLLVLRATLLAPDVADRRPG